MSALLTIWGKQLRKMVVHPEEIVGMLIQPVLWVVLFGFGMRGLLDTASGSAQGDYLTFMVPGIVALAALGGAIAGGNEWLTERLRGFVKEYLVAPIPRFSILAGNTLTILTKTLIQALVILGLGFLIGAQGGTSLVGWLAALVLIGAYAAGFAGIALATASTTDSPGGYHMLIFILNLPLLFASNALYPLAALPAWMRIVALINPTTYLVSGMRSALFASDTLFATGSTLPLWTSFLAVFAFAGLGMLLATRAFGRSIRKV